MNYLLDTHIILWLAYDDAKLSSVVKDVLINKDNKVYFSPISISEIAIKVRKGKLEYSNVNSKQIYYALLMNGYKELPLKTKHSLELEILPLIHNDPFDRLLISQAMSENLTLITHDTSILKYDNVKLLKA